MTPARLQVLACALLCLACGIVDAIGFLRHGIFAANMTGNTVLLGITVAQGDWAQALGRLLPLGAFFLGAMTARATLRRRDARAWIPLVLEAVLIGVAAWLIGHPQVSLFVIAFAMGLQASAVTRFGGVALSTVVITSTMARIAERALDRLTGHASAPARGTAQPPRGLHALTWICYVAGALVAALGAHESVPAMALAAFMVLAAAWTTRREQKVEPS
ncbi:DUF1275 domain-containing protein [Ramlibacter sp. G-1-2-2]|uniref:DUF1275 domain-containing protein n=1 Tax=Ramlibacter agri TaxID=2728837 RepID=A0A848HIB2_9BURK|nr:YoaK family protein [Ramlibacter agri]NML47438.1 DUF1275 domain-containing protein [Ramlibacter agri]